MDWIKRTAEPNDSGLIPALGGIYSDAFLRLLFSRGISTAEEAERFLHPADQPLPDPGILLDIEKAASVIMDAIIRHEKICVFGDYDADGVCATTILYRALLENGADVCFYIPSREGEGYGMHESSVRRLYEQGVKLLVTVDNGISAHAETELARSLGMRVVITDHHRCHETLPNGDAVVCATRSGQTEDTARLCGAAVAMLLARQLGTPYETHLALAALATIADVMPLLGTNRTIVAKGIRLLKREPGLTALLSVADPNDRPVTETTFSFLLAPRINAAGRMGDATRAVRLLITQDQAEREALANELEADNNARKTEEQRILLEAEKRIGQKDPVLIMLHGSDWNPGVIGIVASRLCDKYRCPVLLFTGEGDTLKGSGRSIPGVDLFAFLSEHAEYLVQFGGHLLAAGASILREQFEPCRRAMETFLKNRYPDGYPHEPVCYEEALSLSECTVRLCEELELFAPFGEMNPEPLFLLEGELSGVSLMGKDGAHLSASLTDGDNRLRLVGFRLGQRVRALTRVSCAEVLCTLKKNTFRDFVSVNGYIASIRAKLPEALREAAASFLLHPSEETARKIREATYCKADEDQIRRDFSFLRQDLRYGLCADDLNEPELIAMLVLFEAGILRYCQGMFFEIPVTGKKQIQNGCLYSVMHS